METRVQSSLGSLAPAWDALGDASPLPSPFLRSWWLEATKGAGPCFVLVLDEGGRLVGGLSVEEDTRLRMPRVRFMGAGPLCPDHLDMVFAPGREDDVIAALAAWICRPGARVIDLDGLAHESHLGRALPGLVWRQAVDVAPWSPLPPDPADYVPGVTSRFRNTLKRSRARLERDGVEYRVVPVEEAQPALRALRELHAERWADSSCFLPHFARFQRAAEAGIQRREMVLHELRLRGRTVAVEAWFEVAGRASFYQSGRDVTDPRCRGAGSVLRAAVIDRACRQGFKEVDLLRGDEPYKRDWAAQLRPLFRLRAAHGMGGRAALAALRMTSLIRSSTGGA